MAEPRVIERIGARVAAWWHGDRAYRFEGEQANHADQRAQTQTSIGLMAQAATHGDDEHRIQALQTEATLRARKAVLEGRRQTPGLSPEERWELESVNRGLDALLGPVATPEALGPRRMADFGQVQRRGFLGPMLGPWGAILSSPIAWVAIAFAIPAAGAAVQTARLNHAKAELTETRTERDEARSAVDLYREREEQYAGALASARETATQSAAALEAERARTARRAAIERRRQREIQDVIADSPEPPAWGLRDDEPVQPSDPGAH